MHFTMNGNCNLCYTVHTCNINVIINDFLLGIKFIISRFHCNIPWSVPCMPVKCFCAHTTDNVDRVPTLIFKTECHK